MNYIKEARHYLKYYGDMYRSLENMDKEISRLIRKTGPKEISAIAYSSEKVSGGAGQDEAINILFKLQKLINSREETSKKLKEIDDLLDDLEKGYKYYGQVLRKWHIERTPKEKIAEEIGYSSRTSIYTLEAKAIRKFAVRLFGIDALKAI
jgi:hypothetical protein|nr:MAG TPA: Protein of unknown function (DUF1492) [Caudoviricetes sp.]